MMCRVGHMTLGTCSPPPHTHNRRFMESAGANREWPGVFRSTHPRCHPSPCPAQLTQLFVFF